MRFSRNGFLPCILAIFIAIVALNVAANGQLSVSIAVPTPTPVTAPTGSFTVTATVSGFSSPVTIAKVVFYRNDVPISIDTSSPYQLSQDQLGQDTYTYRARAYDSTGAWADSSDAKLTVNSPNIYKMGTTIGGTSTTGPSRTHDHTTEIQSAVTYIGGHGGGTLFFPCKFVSDTISIYNIKNTITVPSNVTLQGESAEEGIGRCRMYWIDAANQGGACADNSGTLLNKPMFKLVGDTTHVRFKDLWLWSLSAGIGCWPRSDYARIASENTIGIEMNSTSPAGNIKDVIFENVAISNFTYGIKAVSDNSAEYEISDVKIRAYRPVGNFRQLYINAKYAYNWDIQNFNITNMMQDQGAVEIINAGRPSGVTGDNTKIRFLQLNCNGNTARTPAFCVQVEKHGGLYFKQLHHEGVHQAIIVKDISASTTTATTNPDPIIFESSVATGKFYDASMKLYLIGNAVFAAPDPADTGLDNGRLRFYGTGINSTVMDCGDIQVDLTHDTGHSFGMLYTHTERYRGSFFAEDGSGNKFTKAHTYCSQGVSGLPNVNEIGGEYFNSGTMPTETATYSNEMNTTNCPTSTCNAATYLTNLFALGGTVYINGSFTFDHTVTIPTGTQIVGAVTGGSNSDITLTGSDSSLFTINAPYASSSLPRTSGIVIRNLTLKTSGSSKTGIALKGDAAGVGGASDIHFNGLSVEGFDYGFYVRPDPSDTANTQPMVDGLSLKNSTFVDNQNAIQIISGNASNWNVMNLEMTSTKASAIGWDQKGGGHQALQNVTCTGSPLHYMSDCIKLSMTGTNIAGLKQTNYVTNNLTVYESILTHMVIRDSDFRSSLTSVSKVNLLGRAFIVSMNNKYDDFNVQNPYSSDPLWRGDTSRLTYCGDTYAGSVYTGASNGLATTFDNLITGVDALTRVPCGTRPIPWDDMVTWGGNSGDKPLAGNFYDNNREDFVIYREATNCQFLIKQAGGTGTQTLTWGVSGDKGMIGRFFPSSRAQIVIWRPSTRDFWAYDPNTTSYYAWNWGLSTDIPFIGNFIDESGSVTGNKDEVAIYRPSTVTFWILNPRSGTYIAANRGSDTTDYGNDIHVADYYGLGYDQIAQFQAGAWHILNPRTGAVTTVTWGTTGDIAVPGKYLSGSCAQVGVWHPATEEFQVSDTGGTCGSRTATMKWGSNNDYGSTAYTDDIPLNITVDGTIRKPMAYRPTVGEFTQSNSNGQWWVHDAF